MVDLVLFDMPYGLYDTNEHQWDRVLSQNELRELMNQLSAVNKRDNCYLVFFCSPWQMGQVRKVLMESAYKQVMPLHWFKPNANQTGLFRYIPAVEYAVVAYKGDRKAAHVGLANPPEERLNVIDCKSVTAPFRYMGEVLNPCQKPVDLIVHIIRHHCPQGGRILSLGFGSGTDIIAALSAGCDVIGVEADARQFSGAVERIGMWVGRHLSGEGASPEGSLASDAEPQKDGQAAQVLAPAEASSSDALAIEFCVACGEGKEVAKLVVCSGCGGLHHSTLEKCCYYCRACFEAAGETFCRKACHDEKYKDGTHPVDEQSGQVFHLHLLFILCIFPIVSCDLLYCACIFMYFRHCHFPIMTNCI